MRISDLQTLYNYNYWANARILTATANVSQEQFVATSTISHGGLRGTLLHTLAAEWIWRKRCQEKVSPTALFSAEDLPTLADIQAKWREEEQLMRSFLTSLSDEDLDSVVEYKSTGGTPLQNVLWQILTHVVNHGTQTRSEAAVLLTEYGYSPGDLDLIIYLRDHQ